MSQKAPHSNRLKELVMQCLNFPIVEKKRKTMYFRKDGIILAADREDIVYAECINHVLNIHAGKFSKENQDKRVVIY